jgi:hypothetical protein
MVIKRPTSRVAPSAPAKQPPAASRKTAAKKKAGSAPAKAAPAKPVTDLAAKPQPVTKTLLMDLGKPGKPEKLDKPHAKLIRDSFTMPADEFTAIASLKARTLEARRPAKKSELLRAGLQLLVQLDTAALVARLDALPTLKAGRPKKHR